MATAAGQAHPLIVEVLAPSLGGSGLARRAHEARGRAAPGPGAAGGEDAYRLLRLLERLRVEFGDRVAVYLVEPLSWAWFVHVVRHRPRRYPVFLIRGGPPVCGLDEAAVIARVADALGSGGEA